MSEWKVVPVALVEAWASFQEGNRTATELSYWAQEALSVNLPAFDEAAERQAARALFSTIEYEGNWNDFLNGYIACAKRKAGGDL